MIVVFHFLKKMTPDIGGPYSSIENIISTTVNKDLIHIVFVDQLSKPTLSTSKNFEVLNVKSLKIKFNEYKKLILINNKNGLRVNYEIVFHLHGLWTFGNFIASNFAKKNDIPLILSVRGMLYPWALNRNKYIKKIAYFFYQKHILKRANAIHVTSDDEEFVIKNKGFCKTILIPNIIYKLSESISITKNKNSASKKGRKIIFIGRIHPIKALERLISAWQLLPSYFYDSNELIIVGNTQDKKYLDKLVMQAGGYKNNYSISFVGPKYSQDKYNILAESDFLILPSHAESFGNSVLEALFYGLPVIASNGTPWKSLEISGAGWCVSNEVNILSKVIHESLTLDSIRYNEMSESAQLLAEKFLPSKLKSLYINMYTDVTKGSYECNIRP
jgi:glycosyltransferase involved in cell wall biosynthesis